MAGLAVVGDIALVALGVYIKHGWEKRQKADREKNDAPQISERQSAKLEAETQY